MKNNLLTDEVRAQRKATLGDAFTELRGCGRSTSLALKAISDAVMQPGRKIILHDHWGVRSADECLWRMVQTLCNKLELRCMEFSKHNESFLWVQCNRITNDE